MITHNANDYAACTLKHAPKHDAIMAQYVVQQALQRDWTISVYDGAAWTVKKSRDAAAIWEALASTDSDMLSFRGPGDSTETRVFMGKAWFIWGNSPGDTVADYTIGGAHCADDAAWQAFTNTIDAKARRMGNL